MEEKIINPINAIKIAEKLRAGNKKLVLIGGCFDIIHTGHIQFLKNAKKLGDILMVLLESDNKIKQLKGAKRPINSQKDRSIILASCMYADYIITLTNFLSDSEYDRLIFKLKPDIIATTGKDKGKIHKERQADKLGIKVIEVLGNFENQSTSKIAELLRKEI